jgi:DNA-binding protein HU-beta
MTKAELIAAVAEETRQPKQLVRGIVEMTFDQIALAIRNDERFGFAGFGTFSVRHRKARVGYNPHTSRKITIPAARTVGFRPAPKLKKGL